MAFFEAVNEAVDKWNDMQEEVRDKVYKPFQDTFQATLIEQVGGAIERSCRNDCFQAMVLKQSVTRSESLPSDAIMTQAKTSIRALVTTDPAAPAGLPLLSEKGFHRMQLTVGVNNIREANMWYLNDRKGMKYFAALEQDMSVKKLADTLWKSSNFRYILCSDDAPATTCVQLGGKSRMDYLVMPCPHFLSSYTARGIQFDARDAVVLTQRDEIDLTVDSRTVKAELIWMKSVLHGDFVHEDVPDAVRGSGGGPPSGYTRGLFESTVSRADVKSKPRAGNGRALIKIRGFLVFPNARGSTTCVYFGDEEHGSAVNFIGKVAEYAFAGAANAGGLDTMVHHVLDRLCAVCFQAKKQAAEAAVAQ